LIDDGCTLFDFACKTGLVEMVQWILGLGVFNTMQDENSCPSLIKAIMKEQSNIVQELIEHDFCINIRAENDFTVSLSFILDLHVAITLCMRLK
jgi:transcriptional regulator